jgi:hypothetical protein
MYIFLIFLLLMAFVIIALAIDINKWRKYFKNHLTKHELEWSDWWPTKVEGMPGFVRQKKIKTIASDSATFGKPITATIFQFIPLQKFRGENFKQITGEEWQELCNKQKPYKLPANFGQELKKQKRT